MALERTSTESWKYYAIADEGGKVIMVMHTGSDPQEVLDKNYPEDVRNRVVTIRESTLAELQDPDFAEARMIVAGKIVFGMEKCREIWRDKLRVAREPKFRSLDIEYQRASETMDHARIDEIVAQKQVLRDITSMPAIEEAKTPDELRTVWPVELE